jgi:hypothetical protein
MCFGGSCWLVKYTGSTLCVRWGAEGTRAPSPSQKGQGCNTIPRAPPPVIDTGTPLPEKDDQKKKGGGANATRCVPPVLGGRCAVWAPVAAKYMEVASC